MTFGPIDRPKGFVLTELATALARLLSRGGNHVGAILYNNSVERTIPPRTGRNQVLYLARELLRPPEPTSTSTNLSDLIVAGAQTIKRRSLVVVLSDFISVPGWERPLSILSQRHEVIAIRLFDPRERELPDAGWIVVEDAETGELLSVDTSDQEFRRRFVERARERDEATLAAARHAQVDLYPVSTEDDLVSALVRIVELRRGRRLR